MKNKATYMFSLLVLLAACGSPTGVEEKKTELSELKASVKKMNAEIAKLEKEIAKEDTSFNDKAKRNSVLVSTISLKKQHFEHKMEVRGSVESRKNVMLTAETSGKIKSINVTEGQKVSKNQTLMTLNADVLKNNMNELKTSLDLANAVYKRQKNLWDKNIGTEIQYLEAKNKKEAIESQLATANSQLDQAIVKAPFNGVVDEIPAQLGEIASPGIPLVRIVNPDAMYIKADVSERFAGDFKKGDEVDIYFPSQNSELKSTVTSVSEVINANNRTFSVEVKLPSVDFIVKPNQVTVLKLSDYHTEEAIVVPTRVILEDQEGTFVFASKDKMAKKIHIVTGVSYEGNTEVKEGLTGTEILVDKGVRDLTEGTHIEVSNEQKGGSKKVASSNK